MRNFYKPIRRGLLLPVFLFPLALIGQTASISGKITDAQGESLPGATVQIEGTSTGTISDIDGIYMLGGIEPGTYNIVFTYVGYKTVSESIAFTAGQKVTRDITLADDVMLLEETVIIGYGTKRVKDLTGSVTAVSAKDFTPGAITTPEQLVTGKIAGVQITSNGGMPGSGSRIRIRGGTSSSASNDPLIVIDGVPVDNGGISGAGNALNLINPDDIESITVLKDASASAIYGSRAANGVIIITTKKGVISDKLIVEFNTSNSMSAPTGFVDVLTGDEFRDLINTHGNIIQQGLLGTESTDWQDEIFRTGFSTDNNLTLAGGLKKLPYRFNLNYLNDNGILDRSQFSRYGMTLSLAPSLMDNHLMVEANGKAYHTDNIFADQGSIGSAVTFDPTKPVYMDDQTFGGFYEWTNAVGALVNLAPRNPVGLIQQRDDISNVNRFIGNIKLDYKFHFLPDLHGIINLGGDISRSNGTIVVPEEAASSFNTTTGGGVNNQYEQSKNNKLLETYFNYGKELTGISSTVELTGGYSYQNWLSQSPSFASLDFDGDTITPVGIPFETENSLISFYGRLNYNLKEKYLLTATLRDDGSSRFAKDNRWGLFPSVAFAWRITEEDFLKESGVYFKLRLGYGVTGQQDVNNDYPYIANYDSSTSTAQYQFGDTFYYLLRPDGYDPNIKWEETTSYNVGLDFGFMDDRISGSIDIYKKVTDDLLATVPIPAGTNFTNQILTNVGSMENKGVEVNINIVAMDKKDLDLNVGLNATANKNELTDITLSEESSGPGILVGGISGGIGNTVQIHSVGYATNTFYTYEQMYDEDGNPIEGQYVDQNGDSIINADDLMWGENPTPDLFFGFNANLRYKKWTAGFSLRGEIGNYVYNNVNSTRGVYQNVAIGGSTYLQNLTENYNESQFQTFQFLSDYYIEKASYVRMDYFSLGYNFGSVMNDHAQLAVSAVVQNVFVATAYSGLDPEISTGIDNSIYPRPRIFTINLNLKM